MNMFLDSDSMEFGSSCVGDEENSSSFNRNTILLQKHC
jgi:hypothetical protein